MAYTLRFGLMTKMLTDSRTSRILTGIGAIIAGAICLGGTLRATPEPVPPILTAMQTELDRSVAALGKADPAAYFLSYTVSDREAVTVTGSNGALLSSDVNAGRFLEVQTRVGSYQLDNTHKIGDRPPSFTSPGTTVTLDDDIPVLRREIWGETDRQYRAAVEALIKIQTSQQVQVQTAEGNAPDFSHEQPHTYIGPRVNVRVERKPWEERVRKYTAAFSTSPDVLNSIVTYTALAANQYQVNSEGTKLAFGQVHYRLELFVQSKAPDGMDINRFANFDWLDPKETPDDKAIFDRIHIMINEVEALDRAPLVDPYAGPALLTGRATAVFFHEVLGHRLEGFRQKDISEGQTFTKKIGEKILPDFISVKDDPTEERLNGQMLLGYYPFDDEGVPSQDVHLVDNGVLKTFLMGRSPLVDVPHSNGHGRRQLGYQPIARMGNTIVSSSRSVSNAELRQKLIELIKAQHKPYGLLIDDIAGGFTFTGRGQPQAFQVLPLVVYEVFPGWPAGSAGAWRGYRWDAAGFADQNRRDGRHPGNFQRLLRRGIGIGSGGGRGSRDFDFGARSAKEGNVHGQAADAAAARARSGS